MASGPLLTEQEILDGLLLDGWQRHRAEEQLFRQFDYLIREGMKKQGLSQEESFDAYSDTILSAIEQISRHSFEHRSSLKTWIFQIFHHKCVDLIRKKTTKKSSIYLTFSIEERMMAMSDNARTVIEQLIRQADHRSLRQKLTQIGESCQRLLTLWAEGYADKEITAMMEYKSADVVKTSRLRCLEKLRALYQSI